MIANPGPRAKLLRTKAGLSLRQLAAQVGASASTLSRFENGNTDLAYCTVVAVFEALGEPSDVAGFAVELTEVERDYILLLTSLDAMRCHRMADEAEQDYHLQVRYSVRKKLIDGNGKRF